MIISAFVFGIINSVVSTIIISIVVYCYLRFKNYIRINSIINIINRESTGSGVPRDKNDRLIVGDVQCHISENRSLEFFSVKIKNITLYTDEGGARRDREPPPKVIDISSLGVQSISTPLNKLNNNRWGLMTLNEIKCCPGFYSRFKCVCFDIDYIDTYGQCQFGFVLLNKEKSKKMIDHLSSTDFL
jgi:hypothetical protein